MRSGSDGVSSATVAQHVAAPLAVRMCNDMRTVAETAYEPAILLAVAAWASLRCNA